MSRQRLQSRELGPPGLDAGALALPGAQDLMLSASLPPASLSFCSHTPGAAIPPTEVTALEPLILESASKDTQPEPHVGQGNCNVAR